jgi:hypothetical protein
MALAWNSRFMASVRDHDQLVARGLKRSLWKAEGIVCSVVSIRACFFISGFVIFWPYGTVYGSKLACSWVDKI